MPRVVIVGSSNTDLTIQCPVLPGRGETVLGSDLYQAGGGKGANQAVAAARAGAQVAFVGAVGDDDFGRAAVESLAGEGIDVKRVRTMRGVASGVALIFVERKTGENLIGVAAGANGALTPADVDRAGPAIRRADVLLMQLEVPLPAVRRAAEIARKADVPVILNPAPMPAKPLPKTLLKCVDYLVPNEVELKAVGGPDALFRLGVKGLIVTLGAKGARVVTPGGATAVPAVKVRPVDTVGAGDCFCGCLAVGIAEGLALDAAARLACAAAAVSVTRRGAQPSMPTRREVQPRAKG